MDTKTEIQSELDEIRLGDLLRIAWQRKWLIACGTLVFGIAGVILTVLAPRKYSASIVVDPVTTSPQMGNLGGLGAIANEFGGLASLAGLRMPQENSQRAETIAVLQSRALTERYISANNLLPVLFASQWNAKTRRWKATRKREAPTLWTANKYFKSKIREVDSDPKTGLVTLTITWSDPQTSADWANGLVKMTNEYLRQKAIEESQRNIAYLTQQVSKTDDVGIKQAIYRIMQSEISKIMLARGEQQYALKVIDPAQAPERPTSPKPALWIIASLFVGAFLSFLLALIRADAPRKLAAHHAVGNSH